MILKDMIETLRKIESERVEIRDEDGWEHLTCKALSPALEPYKDKRVIEWFPGAAPHKDATFTVYLQLGEEEDDDEV